MALYIFAANFVRLDLFWILLGYASWLLTGVIELRTSDNIVNKKDFTNKKLMYLLNPKEISLKKLLPLFPYKSLVFLFWIVF